MSPSVPILMYHQVSPRPVPAFLKYTVTSKALAAQMNWLDLAGYAPISLDTLLDARRARSPLPSRPVIMTFDDGFQDCFDYAVPVLQAHGFTAIFYLVVGLIGKTSQWLFRERGVELPLMDWPTIRRLETAGFQCGSHTMSHPRLADLSTAACRAELLESRHRLEDHLGHEVRHLAYPHGSFNETVRALVGEAGYRSACSVRIDLSKPDDNPLALHRVPIHGQDSLLDFICRLHAARPLGEALHSKIRSAWQRLQATGAPTLS